MKLKLYTKRTLGIFFYAGIILILLMLWQSYDLYLQGKILQMCFDIFLILALAWIVYKNFKERNELKIQEVEVEKFEQLRSPKFD